MNEHARLARLPRLTGQQIGALRVLIKRVGIARPSHVAGARQRAAITALWARGLVEVWYRQAHETTPSLQGPYFTLTFAGFRLASAFLQPRRSGA